MKREILYSKIKLCKYYDKVNSSQKIDRVKKILNVNKYHAVNENINIFLQNMYKSTGYDHLCIKQNRLKRAMKYKNNVNYRLIEDIMDNDKYKKMSLKDITNKYNENNINSNISISKMWCHIRQLGYRYAKLNTLNRQVLTENSSENQKAVVNFLLNKIIDNNMVFYVDECPLSKNIKKMKGFIKNSVKINNAIGNERIKRTTLIYIIGNNGMYYYEITPDIVNARVFWNFIHDAVSYFKQNVEFNKKLNMSKVCIFMDNAPIHYKRDERAYYVDEKITILYNVPYCCYLNPIEYCFSYLKNHLKKENIIDQIDLIDKTKNYLDENAQNDIKKAVKYACKIWQNMFL